MAVLCGAAENIQGCGHGLFDMSKKDKHQLTARRKNFGVLVAAGTPPTEAVYKAGYDPSSKSIASSMAAQLQSNEDVRALIDKERIKLFPEIAGCIKTLIELRDYSKSDMVRFNAATEIMDRLGWSKDKGKVVVKQTQSLKLPERDGETVLEISETKS